MQNKELVVHVVCHTHDDPGWIWSVDDYYIGSNKCNISVKKILDNMVISLTNNPERKFSYVEMKFFKRWYESQPNSIKEKVKQFIKEKRLEFINGGWVMHDEATVYYKHLLDNMRLGLKFLKEEFNVTPKIGWFIDPFGHSSANAHLMAQMNFDKLVLTRINHQERQDRINNHNLEFIYEPFGKGKKIFTHISYDHYCPSKTLRKYPCDKPVVLTQEELKAVSESFYQEMLDESKAYRHNNMLLYYGDDFSFQEADINYKNIEQIMDYVNTNMKGKMKLIYSTPSIYFDYVEKSNCKFEEYSNEDFFPYADNKHCYWTGYFTSRANLKGLVKQLGIYVSIVSKLLVELYMDDNDKKNKSNIKEIVKDVQLARDYLGVLQHHDAITGTAKERTNKDYENMANIGINKMKHALEKLVYMMHKVDIIKTVCGFEETFEYDKDNSNYLLLNPNYQGKYLFNVRLEPNEKEDSYEYSIHDIHNNINGVGNNISFYNEANGCRYSSLQFEFTFKKDDLFYPIQIIKTEKKIEKHYFNENLATTYKIGDKITFNPQSLEFSFGKIKFTLNHSFYTSYDGHNSKVRPEKSNPDGAYIFAPCENQETPFNIDKSHSFIQQTDSFTSIILRYPHSYLILIFQHNSEDIYTESIFDPINKFTDTGYNYILSVKTNLENINKTYNKPEIFTDSQGINMLQRIKDTHPKFNYTVTEEVSSNFYPITSTVSMKDNDKIITIYSDRAQSAGVINKGEIQLICQRFSTVDDWKGVAEGLYENSSMDRFFSVKHKINIGGVKNESSYFNKYPLLCMVTEKGKEAKSQLDKIIKSTEELDIEFEVKNEKEILMQVGNVYSDYFKQHYKDKEEFNIVFEKGIVNEYNLNGVDIIKENIKGKIEVREQEFKLYSLNFN